MRNESRRRRPQDFVLREICPQRRIRYIQSGQMDVDGPLCPQPWNDAHRTAPANSSGGSQRAGQTQGFDVVPPKVEYSLTALGETFIEPLRALYSSAKKRAALDELDRNQGQNQR